MVGKLKTENLKLKTISIILSVLIFVFSLFALHFTLLASPVYAQESTPSSLQPTTLDAVASSAYNLPTTISPTSPQFTDLLMHNTLHTFSCLMVGGSIIGQPCLTYRVTQDAQGAIQSIPVLSQTNLSGGALGATASLIELLYLNPPVRTGEYLGSLGEQFGIVKQAHAQVSGSGANILSPILALWRVSRNIAYIIMIIIFVVIGLMVMFRQRINPQTVITAQAALPGLIIGLILITFSYFLAALITDTAFIGTNIVGAYFSAAQNPPPPNTNLLETLSDQNVLSITSRFVGVIGQGDIHAVVENILSQLQGGPATIVRLFASFLAYHYAFQLGDLPASVASGAYCTVTTGTAVLNPIAWFSGNASLSLQEVPGCINDSIIVAKTLLALTAGAVALIFPATPISWAIYVVLIAILIYTMFKLLFRLVNNFLTIIFLTVTAPFHFLAASLPGRQGIATGWILNMLCNVLAFPAVIAVFYFVNFLLGSEAAGLATGRPPFPVTGGPLDLSAGGALPLFGGMETGFIRIIIAYVALLATPTIPDLICRAIGRVGQAGQLIGQEIRGEYTSGQQYLGRFGQSGQEFTTGLGGGREWAFNPRTNKYEYITRSPSIMGGAIGVIRRRLGGGTRESAT